MSYEATLLVFGILLLVVGLLGKVKAKELEIGTSSKSARTIIGLLGATLIVTSMVMVQQSQSEDSKSVAARSETEVTDVGAEQRARQAREAAEREKQERLARIAAEEERARQARIAAVEAERVRQAREAAEREKRERLALAQVRLEAEQLARRFFEAWRRQEIEPIIAMCEIPFWFYDGAYSSRQAIRERFHSIFERVRSDPDRTRRIQTLTVYQTSTESIAELGPEWRERGSAAWALSLDSDDLVVSLVVGHDGTPENALGFFIRNTDGQLAVAGMGGS